MAILRDSESHFINQTEPLPVSALCWVLITFIATIIMVRVRVRVRVCDIGVKNFRVKAT